MSRTVAVDPHSCICWRETEVIAFRYAAIRFRGEADCFLQDGARIMGSDRNVRVYAGARLREEPEFSGYAREFLHGALQFLQSHTRRLPPATAFLYAADAFLPSAASKLLDHFAMSETASVSSAKESSPALLRLGQVLFAISDKTRWRILQKLSAAGQPLMVTEIADAIGRKPSSVAKHLAILRKAGITRIGRGRLQQIVPQLLPDPSAHLLDLGYVQLRLGINETV